MELTKTVKDKTFDDYFTEVDHSESISEDRPGSMRLFYLNIRSGKIKISDLEKFTMLNIGRYVFSRAKQEQYEKAGNLDAVMQQALRIMRKRGAADVKGSGNELGEIMIYAFLEEKLKAYKLLSKIELSTDAAQYLSEADGIHFLCADGTGAAYNQMVFGASNIVGEIKDAIDQAFEIIKKISAHEDEEVYMVEKTVLDRFYDEDDLAILKEYVVPEEGKKSKYAISYGVFLGYNFGILPSGRSDDELLEIMQEKLEQDAQEHAEYISQKIKECGLENHAFYFYLLPLNDAENEKKTIMQHDEIKREVLGIEFVQFHQNYSYEDFMMGYKPVEDGFELKNGIFYRFCQKAANQPDKDYFFIIDEINRGNMSKIFGELLMLIEKDYRGVKATLAYNGLPFAVPENLYIIGMMNTADRSLAMIDYALRRRFSFLEMEPGFDSDGFIQYQKSLNNETFNELVEKVKELNKKIASDKSLGKGFCIGHSYFCGHGTCTDEWLHSIVDFDILPMLSEYWFDDTAELQRWENILHGVFQ